MSETAITPDCPAYWLSIWKCAPTDDPWAAIAQDHARLVAEALEAQRKRLCHHQFIGSGGNTNDLHLSNCQLCGAPHPTNDRKS